MKQVNMIRAGLGGLALLAIMGGASCNLHEPPSPIQGYVEAEYVYMSSPFGGYLSQLDVQRGASVTSGAVLFRLDDTEEQSALQTAETRLAQARARLADAEKGQRPSELDAARARVGQAQALADRSAIELQRVLQLYRGNAVAENEYDVARLQHQRNEQVLAEAKAALATAQLGARADQVKAAQDDVQVAAEQKSLAAWRVMQKQPAAPAAAVVFDTLYREGEWVAPGKPVVVLLPPGNIKVRFFASQAQVEKIKTGDRVQCLKPATGDPFTARISYVAPSPEFTPPVIYSRENREKLVFMVEALPEMEEPGSLHPGQPVEVTLDSIP